MNIHAYVDGKYLFTIKSDVAHENVQNKKDTRDYIGVRGSEEIVSIYKEVEKRLSGGNYGITPSTQDELDSKSLDKTNISEYLAKKYPNLERLELRADDDSYTSKISNTMGKQYGYPLVWLNCNKYNFNNPNGMQEHQWERCLFQTTNDLDKMSSLIEYFKEHKQENEQVLYQGGLSSVLDSLKNSATDNLLLKTRRIPTTVPYEIRLMEKYDSQKGFAFYESSSQDTYITNNIESCLNDIIEQGLFDDHILQHFGEDGEVTGGVSKTIKILSPVTVRNPNYSHVTMQAITLSMVDNKINCDVTLYEGLLSAPFKDQELECVAETKQSISDFFAKKGLQMEPISTNVHNLKLQLPLQTHCGRFVMTWMAAEVAGVDITKLSNYSEPFNQIFGKIDKDGDKIFRSGDTRVPPEKAFSHFRENLENFLQVRQEEFKKQYLNTGKEEIALTKELIALVDKLQNASTPDNLLAIEQKMSYLSDSRLKKIINEGMANLGYGSLQTLITQNKFPENLEIVEIEDDFFLVEDITGDQLAQNRQYAMNNPVTTQDMKDRLTEIKKEQEEVNLTVIPVSTGK
ncbi:hypothetical protein Lsan_3178 [Legionella santicrucis]|uniref:Uncharacterized protein n=1 Tax=Legionella santicrucis TaxID=45074 RepID=A0A0W0YFB0_9GAMM|nr:hypothetical protein [Legionella santicrucis]KTD55626.1 hypothetical protein Lsan_3178 [Legionella santicrucis]